MFNFMVRGFFFVVVGLALVLGGCKRGKCEPTLPDPDGTCPDAAATAAPDGTPAVESSPTPAATPTDGDDDDDTGEVTPTPPSESTPTPVPVDTADQACWAEGPFSIAGYRFEDEAELVELGGDTTLDWIDVDPVLFIDASEKSELVTVYTSDECGGSVEDRIYLPVGYTLPQMGDLYNNGIALIFQPDGGVVEINFFAPCGDGTYHGYVLPDNGYRNACEVDFDETRWGAHGGSHISGAYAITLGALTGSDDDIGRPLPVELSKEVLYYSSTEPDGKAGFQSPAVTADGYAASEYKGDNPHFQMGSAIRLCAKVDTESGVCITPLDCNQMLTEPGYRICRVGADGHGYFQVDDSWGPREIAFPIQWEEYLAVKNVYGIDMSNAVGDYATDVRLMRDFMYVPTDQKSAWKSE